MDASSVDQIHLEDQIVLFLGGELDIATVPILQERLAELSTEGVDNIEIDLSNLGFIDSSGLAVLVRSRDDLKRSGGSLVVRNASKIARRLVEVTGLTEILTGAGCSRTPEVTVGTALGVRPEGLDAGVEPRWSSMLIALMRTRAALLSRPDSGQPHEA